jgi:xanthine/uracil/vitamin C permease (AzgA family)
VIVVIVAVLGMPLMLASPLHQETGCPFALGQTAMCATSTLEHMKHWQTAFATILAEMLIIVALALVALRQWKIVALPERSFARIQMRSRVPDRPTLFQELFTRGILNRKEAYRF